MYLKRLHVKHLKRLGDFELDLTTPEGKPRMWTVLIGPNGTAKTSLLQAVALAAAGSKQVNTLAGRVVRHLRDRRVDDDLHVCADFVFTEESLLRRRSEIHPLAPPETRDLTLRSTVTLRKDETSLDGSAGYLEVTSAGPDPLDRARSVHSPLWFVAGYGVMRNLPDSSFTPPLDRPSIDRMVPLFEPTMSLASTSFSNHFLAADAKKGRKAGRTSRWYSQALGDAIKRGGKDLLPDIERLELRGSGGAKSAADLVESDRFHQRMGRQTTSIAGVALSHGYQSTIAWIADLIGQVMLEADENLSTTTMEGLVLIDEIDLYLHPMWQASFITALRRVFPRLQFIATTHSPVVLAELEPHEIVRLGVDDESGDVVRMVYDPESGELVNAEALSNGAAPQPDPRLMTGSELYRTWFGLDRLTPFRLGAELRRYQVLDGDPSPTEDERKELERLRHVLEAAGVALPNADRGK